MSIRTLILLLLFLTQCQGQSQGYTYDMFMQQFGRTYIGEQKLMHQEIFYHNYDLLLEKIKGGEDVQVNNFLDWNETQLSSIYIFNHIDFNNFNPLQLNLVLSSPAGNGNRSFYQSPSSYDWRTYGRVTEVKNQRECGSCWAYASVAQYQSLLSIATNGLMYDLSQQYLIECDKNSYGCQGGYSYYANQIAIEKGIPQQSKYKYQNLDDKYYTKRSYPICSQVNTIKLSKVISQSTYFFNLSALQIQSYLVNYGPLSVGVHSNYYKFLYAGSSGAIDCKNATTYNIDHMVLLVGFNSTHWFIKNSWGTNWGERGYGYIDKTSDCGLKSYVHLVKMDINTDLDRQAVYLTLTDSGNNGWNGNIIGFKQDGLIIHQFGKDFTSGSTYGPIFLLINNNAQTQLSLVKLGTLSQQLGFVLKASNGTILYTRLAGSTLSSEQILFTFCLSGKCPPPKVKLAIFLIDSGNDGWNGNVIGFKQNGSVVGYFGNQFKTGRSFSTSITIIGNILTEIFVLQLGNKTNEVGFTVKFQNNLTLINIIPGNGFTSSTIFNSFCPIGLCTSYNTTLILTMSDTGSDGWNGNVVGLRQNGNIIYSFGSNFTSGPSMGPININLNGKIKTDIVVTSIGAKSQEIGFVLKYSNGTTIYSKGSGKIISKDEVLISFCSLGDCSPSSVSLKILMSSSLGDGWNGNIIGFRQNGVIIGQFGQQFVNGVSYGPIYINLNGNQEAELFVTQASLNPSSVSFIITSLNGTIIYSHSPGYFFATNTIFTTFCLSGGCPSSLAKVIVTMTDSSSNGWQGNIIGFKQNGIIVGQFGHNFTAGSTYGPLSIYLNSNYQTQIIVIQKKNSSAEIGFTVKYPNGEVIFNLNQGSNFSSSTTFIAFCFIYNCIPPTVRLMIQMTDSWGDGWNGNIVGLRQNEVNVGYFGDNFTTGYYYGPIYLTIPNIETEIMVYQFGINTHQMGFSIFYQNGTMIYSRSPGSYFYYFTVFHIFCPFGVCPPPAVYQSKFYVTLTSMCSNGWYGNVLGLRQNGVIKAKLGFSSGTSNLLEVSLQKYKKVDIVVLNLGQKTWEIGISIRYLNGFLIFDRKPGNSFEKVDESIGQFTPFYENYLTVNADPNMQQQSRELQSTSENSTGVQNSSYQIKYRILLVATIFLGLVIVVISVFLALSVYFLLKTRNQLKEKNSNTSHTDIKDLTRKEFV